MFLAERVPSCICFLVQLRARVNYIRFWFGLGNQAGTLMLHADLRALKPLPFSVNKRD